MAQRVEVILEDDIDGSPADETVRFAFNGTQHEIDLSSEHAQALRESLAGYIEHARKASSSVSSDAWAAEAHRHICCARMGQGARHGDQPTWAHPQGHGKVVN